jgi:hypothetical protein
MPPQPFFHPICGHPRQMLQFGVAHCNQADFAVMHFASLGARALMETSQCCGFVFARISDMQSKVLDRMHDPAKYHSAFVPN